MVFTRVRATGALALYVDGVAAGTATGGTQSLIASSTISLRADPDRDNYLQGSLDEVAIYNAAISAATVAPTTPTGTTP